jgi:hypothetical protein
MPHGEADGCAENQRGGILDDQQAQHGLADEALRWVCGMDTSGILDQTRVTIRPDHADGEESPDGDDDLTRREPDTDPPVAIGRVIPRQRRRASPDQPTERPVPVDETDPPAVGWMGCAVDRVGWVGGHRHGAVRPRRRPVRQIHPPDRWC